MAQSRTEMAVIAPSPPAALDNPAQSADTSPMPAARTDPPNVGRMIITLIDNGTSLPVPLVTFDPPGRFTGRLMEHYLTLFAQEIQRAQVRVRHEAEHGPLAAPAPLDAPQEEETV